MTAERKKFRDLVAETMVPPSTPTLAGTVALLRNVADECEFQLPSLERPAAYTAAADHLARLDALLGEWQKWAELRMELNGGLLPSESDLLDFLTTTPAETRGEQTDANG